ncbi:MAG: hypothetical protein IKG30_12760 [Clostridiales bacterium]|nr:hypothetical protein [Clostridiales bacterium]
MDTLRLKVLTPEGTAVEKEAAGLYLRGADGDLAVFPGHIPFVTPVKAGSCTIVTGKDDASFSKNIKDDAFNDIECSIGEGILRVSSNEVLLMVKSYKQ